MGKEVVRFTAPNPERPPWWDHDLFLVRKGAGEPGLLPCGGLPVAAAGPSPAPGCHLECLGPAAHLPPTWHPAAAPAPCPAVVPNQAAQGFALVRSDPLIPKFGLPFQALQVQELHPLPPGGRLLDTNAWDGVFRLAPTQPFQEGQLDYPGVSEAQGVAGRAALLPRA